jgi:hypothetical protein
MEAIVYQRAHGRALIDDLPAKARRGIFANTELEHVPDLNSQRLFAGAIGEIVESHRGCCRSPSNSVKWHKNEPTLRSAPVEAV